MGDYDKWKDVYRNYPGAPLPWELGRPRKVLVELVEKGIVRGGRALDLCCGSGTHALYLAENGFSVTGIDISPHAIAYAKKKAREKGIEAEFVQVNFIDLPFRNGEFDFVLDIGCFHHVLTGDRVPFIMEVHRVLKRGGHYQLTAFSSKNGRDWNHFTEDEIRGFFSERFDILDVKEYGSLESDDVIRHFLTVLMKRPVRNT